MHSTRPCTPVSPHVKHLGLEERLLLLVALRLELAGLIGLLLFDNAPCKLFFDVGVGFGLFGLDLAGFLALLRFRRRGLVGAGGVLAGAIVVVCCCNLLA